MSGKRFMNTWLSVAPFSLFAASAIILAIFALPLTYPGHADPVFYYTVAENLCSGRGLNIDYVWHYLVQYRTIRHPSNDFWMPLSSIIMCGFFKVFGTSFRSAQVSSVLFGTLLIVLSSKIAKEIDKTFQTLFGVVLVGLSMPLLTYSAILPDSGIYYGLFGGATLLCMVRSYYKKDTTRYIALGGLFAGLTALTRNDGILFIVTFTLNEILSKRYSWTQKGKRLLICLLAFASVMIPWIYYIYMTFGTIQPPAAAKVPFLQSYNDLYCPSNKISLQGYLASGLLSILSQKLLALGQNMVIMAVISSPVLVALFVYYLWTNRCNRNIQVIFRPMLVHVVVIFLSYSLIATIIGPLAWPRALMAPLPFLIAGASLGLTQLLRRWRRNRLHLTMGVVLSAIAIGLQVLVSVFVTKSAYSNTNCIKSILSSVRADLMDEGGLSDVVVLTNAPWEVHYSLRVPAVQACLESSWELAHKFGGTHLLSFDPVRCGIPDLPLRPPSFEEHYLPLEHLADISTSNSEALRLVPIHVASDYQLYRIQQK